MKGRPKKATPAAASATREVQSLLAVAEACRDQLARFAGIVAGMTTATPGALREHYLDTIQGYAQSLSRENARLMRALSLVLYSVDGGGKDGTSAKDRA